MLTGPQSKTILIIDDSTFDRTILAKVLSKKIACKIVEAAGSEEAFRILETETIDLILLDVEMPNMSGDEMITTIRETRGPDELPIIMVSGNSDASMVVKCLKLGANDYIEKPVQFEVAVMRILNHLKLTEAFQDKMNLHELAAINAMITTYHHEINNPLTIAKMKLLKLKKTLPEPEIVAEFSAELERIAAVVQKIQEVKQHPAVPFETYSGSEKMVKVK